MVKRLPILLAVLSLPPLLAFSAGGGDDLVLVKQRLVESCLEGSLKPPAELEARTASLQEDGRWPGIDYADRLPSAWKTVGHLNRTLHAARAFRHPEHALFQEGALLRATHLALDAWLDARFQNANWWWNQIGVPRTLCKILALLETGRRAELEAFARCIRGEEIRESGAHAGASVEKTFEELPAQEKDTGYRGIWYMNQPSNDEYVYKYSGGLGTYCAKHQPFAVYRPEVDKTFFCYGGTTEESNTELHHLVSWYDHTTGEVPRPTILLDKETSDAHDNPVISVDDEGYVWIFSTSHGRNRPSFIHRSRQPYNIDSFDLVPARHKTKDGSEPITNFSYMQAWHVKGRGFFCFFTRYQDPAARTLVAMTSADGVTWSEWTRLAAIEAGHYQVSATSEERAGTAFNFHPEGKGLNWRTNLYYLETTDFGETWQTAAGVKVDVPLTNRDNPTLVHDFAQEGRNVYLKDIDFDAQGRPVILFLTSGGYESGPKNAPRTWTTARWTGAAWEVRPAMTSDNNYDMGSLYLEEDGAWRIIAPTGSGPQPYNPGGEMVLWRSEDQGANWIRIAQLTAGSKRNHTYARRPVDAHPGFYAIWADGHGRQPSESRLYLCDRYGLVRELPREMSEARARPAWLRKE